MSRFDRITISHDIVNGQPCIKNTRITVKRVVEAIAVYHKWDKVIEEYPGLCQEDIFQALEWAALNIEDQNISLGAA